MTKLANFVGTGSSTLSGILKELSMCTSCTSPLAVTDNNIIDSLSLGGTILAMQLCKYGDSANMCYVHPVM